MTKRQSVDDLYGGRSFPHGRVRDGNHRSVESEPSFETGNTRGTAFNKPDVQDPEDRHDRRYTGDVADDWRRGGGKGGATGKPSFDRDNSGRRGRAGSLDWGSGHDPATIRKPEPNK